MKCPTDSAFDERNVDVLMLSFFINTVHSGKIKLVLYILLKTLDVQVKMKLMNLGHAQRYVLRHLVY